MRSKTSSAAVAGLALIAVAVVPVVPVAQAKLAPEQQCAKSRYDAAAKYAQCENKALAQHFAKNDLAKLQPALSKCRVQYTATYLKLQKKALGTGSSCDVARFVDNGLTVTDNLTALEWQKGTSGPATWDDAYDDALGFFNDNDAPCFPTGNPPPTCFASHCDWRLPTVAELQTILSEPFPCATSPCIAAVFTGTVTNDDYWSSTTLADNQTYAWGVFFGTGEVSYGLKTTTNAVRVVRGGL